MGGKCVLCGYDKHLHALGFDHIDPSTKTMAVGTYISKRMYAKAREEAKKCRLLCANCHMEQTWGDYALIDNLGIREVS